MKAYVVDDEADRRTQYHRALKRCGFGSIGEAETFEAALEAIMSEKPDLVLCDTNFGDHPDGLALCRSLREKGYSGKIIGASSMDYEARWKACGADGFLNKADGTHGLPAVVDRVLGA